MCFKHTTRHQCACTRSTMFYCASHIEHTSQLADNLPCPHYTIQSQISPSAAHERYLRLAGFNVEGVLKTRYRGKNNYEHDLSMRGWVSKGCGMRGIDVLMEEGRRKRRGMDKGLMEKGWRRTSGRHWRLRLRRDLRWLERDRRPRSATGRAG